jgi:hypothetical protein
MGATYPTKLCLAMKSGNVCALKDCHKPLAVQADNNEHILLGEAAHIYGENSAAKRYRSDMTDEERNDFKNLLYLCPTCHTKIDKSEVSYPADYLFDLKKDHEAWVIDQIDRGMLNVSFAELEVAAKAIASGKFTKSDGFEVIPPKDKIGKNRLSKKTQSLIVTGLSRSSEVSMYLSSQSQLDEDFPYRLKTEFQREYLSLKQSLDGDNLFDALLGFAQTGMQSFKEQAAALAILCHLFELCEVFEK